MSRKVPISQIILHIVVFILAVLVLCPFYLLIVKSFKDYNQEILKPLSISFPLFFENYSIAWLYVRKSILNSFLVSGSTALLTVVLSSMGGYAFSKYNFKGKELLFSLTISIMMMPSILILTSKFVLVTVTLKLHNTYLGVILPQVAGLLPFGFLLLRGYFDSIPKELFDAAKIDGANSVQQFLMILVPLAIPMIMTLFLMNFMTSWNDYLWPLMILQDEAKYTIPVNLQSFTNSFYKMNQYYGPVLAGYVIVSVPILILFGFTSKRFISGMTSGAFKA